MEIKKTESGDSLTLKVIGRLETTTAPLLDEEIKSIAAGVRSLTFDFSELEYVSSVGLRVILSAQKAMNERKAVMTLRGVNDIVKRILDITGFTPILTFA